MENYRDQYELEKLKSLYNEFSFTPIPTRVTFMDDDGDQDQQSADDNNRPKLLKLSYQYRDTKQVKTISFTKLFVWNSIENRYKQTGLPEEQQTETITLQATSLNGQRTVYLKSKSSSSAAAASADSAKNNKPNDQYLIVYDRSGRVKTIELKSLNDELQIIDNPNFGKFVLNDDGRYLLCVGELQPPKSSSSSSESSNQSKAYDLDAHEYRQSWGEKFQQIYHTSIILIDLDNLKLIVIDKTGISLGQPFFFGSNDDSTTSSLSIGCIGFKEVPYKLGLIYCTNRISYLFGVKINNFDSSISTSPSSSTSSSMLNVEPEIYYGDSADLSILSPRCYYYRKSGGNNYHYSNRIIFLERNAGGAHDKAARLQLFDMETRKLQTIVDNNMDRELINKDGQVKYSDYGPIFTAELPRNCFSNDGKHVFFDSETPFYKKSFSVNIETRQMKMIEFADSTQLLDIRNDWICAIGSSLNQFPTAYLGYFKANNNNDCCRMEAIDEKRMIDSIEFGMFMLPSKNFENKYVIGIWTSPKDMKDKPAPTVVLPHGGPHSHLPCSYFQSIALYNALGLKTCLVNYVGSTGVDQSYVEALLGNVGRTDVQDLLDCINYMIANQNADRNRIILCGGSHGGFLVTNISGQHPEMNFLACIARNPVIDIALMSGITDIPDWNVAEALGYREFQTLNRLYPQNSDELVKMYEKSPLSHIRNVKVPTLLTLGKDDLRVPYLPGLLYHRILKSMGIETRCLVYDDQHDLFKINVDYDCFLNIAKFLEKFIYYNA